ncbi:MAG: 1,2-phenylacetyl-CoA epoxidase, subunit E, partial [uncultured Gemmatimonadaceae bacterium]
AVLSPDHHRRPPRHARLGGAHAAGARRAPGAVPLHAGAVPHLPPGRGRRGAAPVVLHLLGRAGRRAAGGDQARARGALLHVGARGARAGPHGGGDAADGQLPPPDRPGARAPLPGRGGGERDHPRARHAEDDPAGRAPQPVHAGVRQPRVEHDHVPRGVGRPQEPLHEPAERGARAESRAPGRGAVQRPHHAREDGAALPLLGGRGERGRRLPLRPAVDGGGGARGVAGARRGRGAHQERAVRRARRGAARAARGRRGGGRRDVRGDGDPRRARALVHDGAHHHGARGRAGRGGGAALRVQGRRVLDVPRDGGGGGGGHGRELLARGLRAGARLRAHLPELPGDRQSCRGLRPM